MADTLWVKSGYLDSRVAHWERDLLHPGGEVFVAGEEPVEVARTAEVQRKLGEGILVETTKGGKPKAGSVPPIGEQIQASPVPSPIEPGQVGAPAPNPNDPNRQGAAGRP